MKSKLTRDEVHGRDTVGVAGGVGDQEHEAQLRSLVTQQQIYWQEMTSKLVHNGKM